MANMPKLPFDTMCEGLDEDSARIIRAARNRRTGCLRASKPFDCIDFHGDENEALFRACANYVWRMFCFDFVDYRPHSCMPCTADFDIDTVYYLRAKRGDYNERCAAKRVLRDSLDALIKRVESVLPITEQKGAMRWARAYGLI